MLLIKSKFKIAKRLGAAVFEKTQSQKFELSAARSGPKKQRGGRGGGSDFGKQLLEKQRVRFTYGIPEKQLYNYAHEAITQKDPSGSLNRALEMRADSVIYRSGFASTRRAARQMASHGHILVNGVRINTPSRKLNIGDVLTVREGSQKSPLFAGLAEEKQENGARTVPQWLNVDLGTLRAEIIAEPQYNAVDVGLDFATVFEFYSR